MELRSKKFNPRAAIALLSHQICYSLSVSKEQKVAYIFEIYNIVKYWKVHYLAGS